MLERTPPPLKLAHQESTAQSLKIIDPKIDDSDFDSNTSSGVYRIVPIDYKQSKEDLEEAQTLGSHQLKVNEIIDLLYTPQLLLFDPVSSLIHRNLPRLLY